MGSRTTKRDSKGQLTVCPKCEKPVRGAKGLKAHATVCIADPSKLEEGFWWARWHTVDPATLTNAIGMDCDPTKWVPVEVWASEFIHDEPVVFHVFVLGVDCEQPVENFEWGARIQAPDQGAA